ncbi:MAG: phosphoribosylaminoimidazolesuccinocarboxamide synthase [Ignavibacteria bacterium]|nr:phosphoribosylaminoimidazolesuccinocarboxamide synthase [Ignavibacteria bacterium]
MNQAVRSTDIQGIPLFRRGKVRDVYDLGDSLLIVATDRISAFDVIMDDPIPGKGKLLTELSLFWFDKTRHIIDNHIISTNPSEYPVILSPYHALLEGRSMLVKKTSPLPIECVVRGYLAGSGWKEYQQSGTICGIMLPPGLQQSQQLPEPIFTPATKAEEGHDENISLEQAIELCGKRALEAKEISLKLYDFAHEFARTRGIILADTKFEFGVDNDGALILIDEALTPDSSRYWLKETYNTRGLQENFDKQVLRDYLETLDWNKEAPSPQLPQKIIDSITAKYQQAISILTKG